jgi:hypothetical protein
VIALIILMPSRPWRVAAIISGVSGLMLVGSYWRAYRAKERPSKFDRLEIRLSLISFTTYSLLIVSALLPEDPGLYLLATLSVWFLISGSIESWWLLKPPGIEASESDDGEPITDGVSARPAGGGRGPLGNGGGPERPAAESP